MRDRLLKAGLYGGMAFGGVWVVAALAFWLNSMVPWWIPASIGIAVFIIEWSTQPLFDRPDDEADLRELRRQEALANLASMSDEGLTER